MYEYAAVITRVVDGDTVHVQLDLGCDVRINLTVRLFGINAPELPTDAGKVARDWLVDQLAAVGNRVLLKTVKDRREKYGRYLGILQAGPALVDLNKAMVAAGHAEVYLP
jgi:endonuclease YncB( thermonuclease family)